MFRLQVLTDWRIRVGVVVGIAAAVAFGVMEGERTAHSKTVTLPAHGPVLSDCDGAIRELVIQYVPEAAEIVETAYRQFLREFPASVTVHVVCPGRRAYDDFRQRVGPMRCRLNPVFTGHPMTCWARDRWLALRPAKSSGPAIVLSPAEETGEKLWPARKGDRRIGNHLAAALNKRVIAYRSKLSFDGGDFVADAETVFVTPSVRLRNVGRTTNSEEELAEKLGRILQRRIVLLPEAPEHHAGMFMMPVGERTILVGDPSLAARLLDSGPPTLPKGAFPLDGPDFSEETCARFDAVAERCAAEGYRVIRIPVAPASDGRTYLTYLNVIIDCRSGRRIVYMPVFDGAERLNDAAETVWRNLGYRVHRVDCTNTYRHFGSLRCLVNILRRT